MKMSIVAEVPWSNERSVDGGVDEEGAAASGAAGRVAS